MSGLTPVDTKRCQAEKRSFMTLGPGHNRCTAKATWVAKEKELGPDGQRGAMSLCDECKTQMEKMMDMNAIQLLPIVRGVLS